MLQHARVPIVGFAAWSGTGKTTLLRHLLPLLRARGLRVGAVKHAHHEFDIDHGGKDSYELRKAGAERILIASRKRWALMVERELAREPVLDQVLKDLDQSALDLLLVEGFKEESFPKIELYRPVLGKPLLCHTDPDIVAVASDSPLGFDVDVPVFDLNQPASIAAFIWSNVIRPNAASMACKD